MRARSCVRTPRPYQLRPSVCEYAASPLRGYVRQVLSDLSMYLFGKHIERGCAEPAGRSPSPLVPRSCNLKHTPPLSKAPAGWPAMHASEGLLRGDYFWRQCGWDAVVRDRVGKQLDTAPVERRHADCSWSRPAGNVA